MSTISSYDSNSISSLFSSLNHTSNTASGLDFGMLASIRNGSYKKLVTAYYDNQKTNSSTGSAGKTDQTDTSGAAAKANAVSVRDAAISLRDAADGLNSRNLWEKKTTTDSKGNTTTDYDKDAINKAITSFVTDYNSLVDATGKSTNNNVLKSAATMVGYTKANKDLLSSIGITIGSNNKLTVDESQLKNADLTTVKSVFTGAGSYGRTVSGSASSTYAYAVSQLAQQATAGTYTSDGSYKYISGAIYNTYL
jgi:flagellar capping protein FliD